MTNEVADEDRYLDELPPATLESIVRGMPTDTALLVAVLGAEAEDEILTILRTRQTVMAPVIAKQSLRMRIFQFTKDKTAALMISATVLEAGFGGYYRGFYATPNAAATYWESPALPEDGIDLVVVGRDIDPQDALAWRPKMQPRGVIWLIEQGVAV